MMASQFSLTHALPPPSPPPSPQDFLKWRGLLLTRFLATAVDPDPDMVSSIAQYG